MKSSWRLTNELVALFISGKLEVYLADPEKKQYIQNTKKLIVNESYKEKNISDNQFQLKLGISNKYSNSLSIYIKSDEFPTNNWYLVSNIFSGNIGEIVMSHTITNGEIPEDIMFEASFSETVPGLVSFVEPGMPTFKPCFEEMSRRLNCELCKKTTNWIPGHRYDTLSDTIYVLAKVRSRKGSEFNSVFLHDLDSMPEVYIYVNNIREEDKTVNDILRSRNFGIGDYDLKIAYKKSLRCDSGKVLEDDFTGEIQNYWENMFDNSINNKECSNKDAFIPFSLVSKTTEIEIINPEDTTIVNKIEEKLHKILTNVIVDRWNINSVRTDLCIGVDQKESDNIERLSKLLLTSDVGISDPNFQKILYYKDLFEYIGVDIRNIIRNSIYLFKSRSFNTFEEFYEFKEYFNNQYRFQTRSSVQRSSTLSHGYKLETVYIKDLYGEESELTKTLIDFINYINDNCGIGASGYSVIEMGSKKEPASLVKCFITLDDLIKYKKGVSNLSESLKYEIVQNKFVGLHIDFDKDIKLQ